MHRIQCTTAGPAPALAPAGIDAISQVVNDWVNLDSWSPDFATYWYNSEQSLPADLKDFIISIGIDISYHINSIGIVTKQAFGTPGLDSI